MTAAEKFANSTPIFDPKTVLQMQPRWAIVGVIVTPAATALAVGATAASTWVVAAGAAGFAAGAGAYKAAEHFLGGPRDFERLTDVSIRNRYLQMKKESEGLVSVSDLRQMRAECLSQFKRSDR